MFKIPVRQCWKRGLGIAICGAIVFAGNSSLAQITPDRTLPNNSNVQLNGSTFNITGGTQAGANLFHSFQQFSVPTNSTAFFNNAADIQNILSRVTGGSRSNINGLIRANGTANLFLINPNGIIFGPNASLNIGGSFLASTASSLKFADATEFSAKAPQTTPLLTISVPIGLQFGENAGGILNQSLAGLQVQPNKTLALVGGDVNLNGGGLIAAGGRVELGGLADSGTVGINGDGSLSFPVGVQRGDVTFTNFAFVDVRAGGGGFITVNAKNVEVSDSVLLAGIQPGVRALGARAGDIKINATENVRIEGKTYSSEIANTAGDISRYFSDITTQGSAGDVIINTGTFEGIGSFVIGSATNAQGDAGRVIIVAKDKVSLTNPENFPTAISSVVGPSGIGNSGDIVINTPALSLSKVILVTSTAGQGNAGNIQLNVAESIAVNQRSQLQAVTFGKGNAGNIVIEAENANVSFDGVILGTFVKEGRTLGTVGTGNGGDITIKARVLSATNGAQISSSTYSKGNAGIIRINASDNLFINGNSQVLSGVEQGGVGDAGGIELNTRNLSVSDTAFVTTNSYGKGNAGIIRINAGDTVSIDGSGGASGVTSIVLLGGVGDAGGIELNTKNLFLSNNAVLTTSTIGKGNAGTIRINASDTVSLNGNSGVLSTVEPESVGNAGGIEVNTRNLSVSDTAFVTTNSYGKGNAGIIRINAGDTVSIDGSGGASGVFSSVALGGEGNAGGIELNTKNLFLIKNAALTTSILGKGNAGTIRINASDTVSLNGNSGVFSTVQPESVGNAGSIELAVRSLSLTNGGRLSTSNLGNGAAGNIKVTTFKDIRLDNQASISATTKGGQGNINLRPRDLLLLRRGSNITTNATGTATGGNITINTNNLLAVPKENSDISANAQESFGGRVNINTKSIFGIQFRQQNTLFSDITASSELGPQFSGSVEINTPDIDPTQGLLELRVNFVDASQQIDTSYRPDSKQQRGSFVITGRGSLRPSPYDMLTPQVINLNLATLEPTSANHSSASGVSKETPTTLPEPIVEATGLVRNDKGEVFLVANSPVVTPNSPRFNPASCSARREAE